MVTREELGDHSGPGPGWSSQGRTSERKILSDGGVGFLSLLLIREVRWQDGLTHPDTGILLS